MKEFQVSQGFPHVFQGSLAVPPRFSNGFLWLPEVSQGFPHVFQGFPRFPGNHHFLSFPGQGLGTWNARNIRNLKSFRGGVLFFVTCPFPLQFVTNSLSKAGASHVISCRLSYFWPSHTSSEQEPSKCILSICKRGRVTLHKWEPQGLRRGTKC